MLHLPVWAVVSLLVVCPKMWQIVLSPNKIPEHRPAAKAADKIWKIQITVKDRKRI